MAAHAQGLEVIYGGKGVQRIAFQGTVLADAGAHPEDLFHIWHMKSADLAGNASGGWGESNTGTSWDAGSHTETYNFAWGSISTQFVQAGDNLDMIVTERNNGGSGVVFYGAEIYPFVLRFPQDPVGFSGYTQYAITTTGPGVSVADFGSGVVTSVIPDESVAMYGGWKNVGGNAYSPLMTTSSPDGLATFLPHLDRPVTPGSTFSYTVSLRFTPAGVAAAADDAYTSFAARYPSQMTWTDHRILGTAYLASAPPGGGDSSAPGGFAQNPRRYFNDASIDITTPGGLQSFQKRMLAQAAANVATAKALNAQGVITWDLEGEQYPHATTYVCSPDQVAKVAPEMETVISDSSSAYFGQKLDDAYFKTMTSAGVKVGVCLRPQVFTVGGDGHASQIYLGSNTAIVANLETKAKYANGRWGATIFYVDSTVDANGGTLDPAIFQQLITDMPGFLFIPEESTPRYYAYSAPFYSFIFHGETGTPAAIYKAYPHAFGANLINDADGGKLAAAVPQLTQAVKKGDILMGHADYWQANDATLVSIYQAAGQSAPPPVQVSPAINWPVPAGLVYGTPLSAAQLNASANTPGTFVYAPSAGTVLSAGNQTLMATFTPSDSVNYSSGTATVALAVAKASPAVVWAPPSPVLAGSALGPAQLNATANVPGLFTYTPGAGTVVAQGVTTLQTEFMPSDTQNYSSSTAAVSLTVTNAAATAPSLHWDTPSAIIYGTPLDGAQLNAAASVPGVFNYLPSAGTLLKAGLNPLVAVFTPSDTAKYTSASASVSLTVLKATPVLTWPVPAAIAFGTVLDAAQLNASANVAGTFSYAPGPGSILAAGTQTLNVLFTPSDSTDYLTSAASVPILVTAAVPAPSPTPVPVAPIPVPVPVTPAPTAKLAILSLVDGMVVSGTTPVVGQCLLQLDAAASYLLVDGIEGSKRVGDGPYVYQLETKSLSNGPHVIQIWAHDIGNNTTISAPVTVIVSN